MTQLAPRAPRTRRAVSRSPFAKVAIIRLAQAAQRVCGTADRTALLWLAEAPAPVIDYLAAIATLPTPAPPGALAGLWRELACDAAGWAFVRDHGEAWLRRAPAGRGVSPRRQCVTA